MNQPAFAALVAWGVYLPAQDSGRIYLKIRNDSTGTMKGYIRFVLTEDSIYYAGPNSDPWHNHVARDYLPDTSGTFAQLAPNESVTVYRNFRVGSGWNENRCKIVYWFQNDSLRADSSKPVYQAGVTKVMDLVVGIEETTAPGNSTANINVAPNPCLDATTFRFQVPVNAGYEIRIFDVSGRLIRTLTGISRKGIETLAWNLRNDQSERVNAGVYLYKFESTAFNEQGKIVVR